MKYLISLSFLIISAITVYLIYPKEIVNSADYEQYLVADNFNSVQQKLEQDLIFWNKKLANSPDNFVFQKQKAALLSKEFKLTGDIEKLKESQEILENIHQRFPNQVGVLHSLVANAISRHAFLEAEKYAAKALEIGEKKHLSLLLSSDVAMERGNLAIAKFNLDLLDGKNQFNHQIREMKIHDAEGDLTSAIETMEAALEVAKSSGNQDLINWSLSNLGDMYGHDGRIQKSYETYLEALKYNTADFHSLKGIAWIAFSNDKKTAEAKQILHFLQQHKMSPDYDLLLSEIAAFENKPEESEKYKTKFLAEAQKEIYGNMYQRYIALEDAAPEKSMKIAQQEVNERPHPMSYELLAWAHLQNGEKSAALSILENHVIGKTSEPDAIFHAGIIFKENGQTGIAKEYLEEALDAAFELGPIATREIEAHLSQL